MIRSPPALLPASARYPQPGRGRHRRLRVSRRSPSARRRRSGRREPSSSISPVAATLLPWSTSRPSSSRMSSAKARPADGPPTSPRSMSTLTGSLMSADCADRTPMIGRASGRPGRIVRTSTSRGPAVARTREPTGRPASGADGRRRSSGVLTACPRRATITRSARACPSRGRVGRHASTMRAVRLGLDVVAELAQRDGGGDLLGAVHLARGSGAAVAVVVPGGTIASSGTRSAPLGRNGATSSSSSEALRTSTST